MPDQAISQKAGKTPGDRSSESARAEMLFLPRGRLECAALPKISTKSSSGTIEILQFLLAKDLSFYSENVPRFQVHYSITRLTALMRKHDNQVKAQYAFT